MKALCMCNSGAVRSPTLARLLRKRGLEALAIGVDKEWGADLIEVCCKWAEVIFVQKDALEKFHKRFFNPGGEGPIPEWAKAAREKVDLRFDVGLDDWKVPQDPDLLRRLRKKVEAAFDDRQFRQLIGMEATR